MSCVSECETIEYNRGDSVVLTGEFTDINGGLFDPALVEVFVQTPDGTNLTPVTPVTNPSIGTYQAVFPIPDNISSVGRWYYAFRSDGSNPAYEEDWFQVRASILVGLP